jgi:hypothetical protein
MNKTLNSIELNHDVAQGICQNTESTLQYSLKIMEQLSRWLVKSGIGHHEFSEAMRTLFYNAALEELEELDHKKTDSAVSLLSGLNRREVSQLRRVCDGTHQHIQTYLETQPVSVPSRVIALWVHLGLPTIIPTCGLEGSFEWLVKQISTEKHPRSILCELVRLKLVIENGPNVFLQTQSFSPDPSQHVTKQIFSENIADHLAAGVANLTQKNDFLEQAVFADELTQESVDYLKQKTHMLWEQYSKNILAEAIQRCHQDQGKYNAHHRFRVGVYQYDSVEQLQSFKNTHIKN